MAPESVAPAHSPTTQQTFESARRAVGRAMHQAGNLQAEGGPGIMGYSLVREGGLSLPSAGQNEPRGAAGVSPAGQVQLAKQLAGGRQVVAKKASGKKVAGTSKKRAVAIFNPFVKALRWKKMLETGEVENVRQLTVKAKMTEKMVRTYLRLLDLAPDVVEILSKPRRLPYRLSMRWLLRVAAKAPAKRQLALVMQRGGRKLEQALAEPEAREGRLSGK